MRREEYENICQAVNAGEERYLHHNITHQVAKVSSCRPGDFFDVQSEGDEHKSWAMSNVSLEKRP